ncbi:2477_t:CDS:2, partial [Funneliformis mosseae]
MAYIECKVWHFQEDDDIDLKSRYEAMKAECTVDSIQSRKKQVGMSGFIFPIQGKDRLVSTNGDDLWLREAKIDMEKQGLTIYGDF